MLRLWTSRETEENSAGWYERLFLDRYQRIVDWAVQLAGGRNQQADDLVQDAFVFLVNTRPDFSRARNTDAYIYGILRNLHRAQLNRTLRQQGIALSIFDFDSVESGLRVLDADNLLQVQNDLRRICSFACRRKETSKSASILILRFFHGYYPSEIAAICRSTRHAVEERLSQARLEAIALLEDPGKVHVLGETKATEVAVPTQPMLVTSDALLAELARAIFSSARPLPGRECLSRGLIRQMYTEGPREMYRDGIPASFDHTILAHIVSCRACLENITAHLGLVLYSDRDPNDMTGNDPNPPKPPNPTHSGGGSKTRNPLSKKLLRWKRAAAAVLEHHPKQLFVAVNGQPYGSHKVVAAESDFAVTLPLRDEIQFVEVYSEQQVRLLLMPVSQLPPEGPQVQDSEMHLSDGRRLALKLSFDSPWPTVHLSYHDPEFGEIAPAALNEKMPAKTMPPATVEKAEIGKPMFTGIGEDAPRPRRWPWLLTPALALALIVAVFFVQSRQTTVSAASVIEHAVQWEQAAHARPGSVLHRSFDFVEHQHSGGKALHRRVEVWRRKGGKVSRLYDSSGRVLGSAKLAAPPPVLSTANAWQFDPAPDSYRAIAGDMNSVRVKLVNAAESNSTLQLESPSASLLLDRVTYRPVAETISTAEADFQFSEAATETIPEAVSPFAEESAPAIEPAPRAVTPLSSPTVAPPAVVSDADLDEAEAAVWVGLHAKGADLGEELHVRRRAQEIELAGVVDSEERKRELIAKLEAIPHVRISLLSPEDVPAVNDNVRSALSRLPDASASPARPPLLVGWLEQNHPDAAERRAWVAHVLDLSRGCLRRTYALRMLSERYPNPDRAEILQIVSDDQRALKENWKALSEAIEPVMSQAVPGDIASASSGMGDASSLFLTMQSLHGHLLNLLADDAGSVPGGAPKNSDVAAELRAARQDWGTLGVMIAALSRN